MSKINLLSERRTKSHIGQGFIAFPFSLYPGTLSTVANQLVEESKQIASFEKCTFTFQGP